MVEVYSKDNCPFCVKAKMLLDMKQVEFVEKKVGVDVTREELLEIAPQARTVPQIVIDGEVIGGYDQLTQYFDNTVKMV